jgi:hypothetical protein
MVERELVFQQAATEVAHVDVLNWTALDEL